MDRDLLAHLPIVVAVAREKGFAAAASVLNMSASAVSHAVKAVEDRLGEPLFARTTRSVSLTEAGAKLIAAIGASLEDITAAVEALTAARGAVTGTLRINAPHTAMPMGLTSLIAKLAWEQPRLTIEVHTNEAFVDIVAQGFDAGVRLGEFVQQDMVTVRLTDPFDVIMVASPDYLRAKGEPKALGDLAAHNCIGYRLQSSGSLYEWDVVADGKDTKAAVIARSAQPVSLRQLCAEAPDLRFVVTTKNMLAEPVANAPANATERYQGYKLYRCEPARD